MASEADCFGRDYVYGGVSSLVNVFVTFPINKVMFRQQVEGIRLPKAFKQVFIHEGLSRIYRGLLPPLIQRTITVSLMFGAYSQSSNFITRHFPSNIPYILKHTMAATSAGCIEAILVPLERAQCLLQDKKYNKELLNTKHTFQVIYRTGLKEFYRGLTAVLLRNSLSNVMFLGLRGPLKNSLPTPETQIGESFNSFISGAGLGMFLSTLFFPLNVVKTRMMTNLGGDFLTIRETFIIVFNERNKRWRKMFRGVHINYTRAFLSWGIINMTFDALVKWFG